MAEKIIDTYPNNYIQPRAGGTERRLCKITGAHISEGVDFKGNYNYSCILDLELQHPHGKTIPVSFSSYYTRQFLKHFRVFLPDNRLRIRIRDSEDGRVNVGREFSLNGTSVGAYVNNKTGQVEKIDIPFP